MVRRAVLGHDLGHPYATRAGASRTYVADLPSLQLADPLGSEEMPSASNVKPAARAARSRTLAAARSEP